MKKQKLKLRGCVKTLLILIILESLLICYLLLCSNRITEIEKNEDTSTVSVNLWR